MEIQIPQEDHQLLIMGSNMQDQEQDHGYVVKKRKRTQRHRAPSSPNPIAGITTTTTSTTSSSTTTGRCDGNGIVAGQYQFSPENSSVEEDMANCLILLAQGGHSNKTISPKRQIEEIIAGAAIERCRKITEVVSPAPAAAGSDVYECKTCNRCFPSFQALGGHRASHKRPVKPLGLIQDQEHKKFLMLEQEQEAQFIHENTSLTLQMGNNNRIFTSSTSSSNHQQQQSNNNNNKSRIHECSICGSEFSSGQALGGHMRRHRSSTTNTTTSSAIMSSTQLETVSTNKKSRNNGLSLDLNLPAPEEEHMNKFIFTSKPHQPALVVFSAPSLVDCHY